VKHYFTITLLYSLVLVPHNIFSMDSDNPAQDHQEQLQAPAAQPGQIEDMEMWLTGRLHWAEPDGIIVIIDE